MQRPKFIGQAYRKIRGRKIKEYPDCTPMGEVGASTGGKPHPWEPQLKQAEDDLGVVVDKAKDVLQKGVRGLGKALLDLSKLGEDENE